MPWSFSHPQFAATQIKGSLKSGDQVYFCEWPRKLVGLLMEESDKLE